jgi:hypothetical protein
MVGNFDQETLDFLDFARCVRPNGTAYGTGGTCRKGVEEEKTVDLGQRASAVINEYVNELQKIWPEFSKEEMTSFVREYTQLLDTERKRVKNGDVTLEEIENHVANNELPFFQGKKFAIVGMEPGMATENFSDLLATELVKTKISLNGRSPELIHLAASVIRSMDPNDKFARTVVGQEPKRQRGNTFSNQLAYLRSSSLRPEQMLLAIAHGNVRAVPAKGVGVQGVYGAINQQRDPRLKKYGRSETARAIPGRVKEIVRRLQERGKDKDFEGGLFAPGKPKPDDKTISLFVKEFKATGGRVVEHTTMIGKNADEPMKTWTLQLENGNPFVIFGGSLSDLKLAGKNLKRAYDDTVTNFVKETQK